MVTWQILAGFGSRLIYDRCGETLKGHPQIICNLCLEFPRIFRSYSSFSQNMKRLKEKFVATLPKAFDIIMSRDDRIKVLYKMCTKTGRMTPTTNRKCTKHTE